MRAKITASDCTSCGLCCISLNDQDAFCDVTTKDEALLGKKFVRLHVLRPSLFDRLTSEAPHGVIKTKWRKTTKGPLRGISLCGCVALVGDAMHRTKCSVYKRRPRVCREAVKPGDKTCRWLRDQYTQIAPGEREQVGGPAP